VAPYAVDRVWGVYLISVFGIIHEKFWVALAPSGDNWHGVFINSELSQFDARNPSIMASTHTLSEAGYAFLSHDSYFSATEHVVVPEADLAQIAPVGIVRPADRPNCIQAIEASETLKIRVRDNMLAYLMR